MRLLAFVAFALWAIFMRCLPRIMEFLRVRKFASTVPGPTIGELIENTKKRRVFEWLLELAQRHGSVFRIWFGMDLIVFFSDPDDIQQILSSNQLLEKSNNYEQIVPWLGRGLLTNGGHSWHQRRKLLTPAFHFRILGEFKEPMEENCRIMIDRLREHLDGPAFDIYPYLTLFALDVICETAMGIRKNAQLESDSEYVQAVQNICTLLHRKSFSSWQRLNVLYDYTADGRAVRAALKVLHSETQNVIKVRRKQLLESNIHSLSDAEKLNADVGSKRRFAFLDMLLIGQMEGGSLSDRDIREEVDTFMFAGHDTTSASLGFTLYMLSQHADVQQRAYEEAVVLRGQEKAAMPYLEAVIRETLRIFAPVPFFSRRVVNDVQIGKITVPKGATVSSLACAAHRDERYFPEPEKFEPERHLGSSGNKFHPYSYVAFSAGPRNCIGQKFAMLELKSTLAKLLRSYVFLPAENFKPQPLPLIVLKSGNGIKLKIKER